MRGRSQHDREVGVAHQIVGELAWRMAVDVHADFGEHLSGQVVDMLADRGVGSGGGGVDRAGANVLDRPWAMTDLPRLLTHTNRTDRDVLIARSVPCRRARSRRAGRPPAIGSDRGLGAPRQYPGRRGGLRVPSRGSRPRETPGSVAAAHGDDHVGALDGVGGEDLRSLVGDVDSDLGHGLHGHGVDASAGAEPAERTSTRPPPSAVRNPAAI